MTHTVTKQTTVTRGASGKQISYIFLLFKMSACMRITPFSKSNSTDFKKRLKFSNLQFDLSSAALTRVIHVLPEFVFLGGVENEDAVWVTLLLRPGG